MKRTKYNKTKLLGSNSLVKKSMASVLGVEKSLSVVGKICERSRFCAGTERDREIWMARTVNQQLAVF